MVKEHKRELVIVGLMLLLIIALIGVSYAAFSYSKLGTKVNTITTGSITMSYEETDNTISLSGALPTTDATGKVRLTEGEYFDFTVSSEITGNVNINYEISAKDVTTSDRKIDGSNIKLYLTELVDGEEKELMTPEVYNEETSSNTYTGRPANEMSLYTSSMNSSEEHQYRLRMYVDESYNPQGDGGNLQFSVKINVYGKDGEKPPTPTAVDTLIAKVNPEDLDYNSATDTQKKEMWTFSHPETEQTEALTDYRYIGSDPNNYVTFYGETWRIIGVFSVDDGKGKKEERLKLIRNESIGNMAWDSNNINDWSNATLNANLNSGDYWTKILSDNAKSMIGDTLWYLGGSSTYNDVTASMFYERERGTTVYSGRDTSWVGKVGLMYPSDYGYATSGGSTTDRNACLNKELFNWDSSDLSDCKNNDWIFNSSYQWTITPNASASANVFNVSSAGYLGGNYAYNTYIDVRPVVFLKSNIKIVDGDGSSSNPYILQN